MAVQPSRLVALLRGINVGGRATIAMDDLRTLFHDLGHTEVTTYLQSGNVVFACDAAPEVETTTAIERALAAAYGLEIAVLLRSGAEIAAVESANPFAAVEQVPTHLHTIFLRAAPPTEAVARLDPLRSPGDAFAVHGRAIYLHLPHGSGSTKLTLDYFERTLDTVGTARNANTTRRLLALLDESRSGDG